MTHTERGNGLDSVKKFGRIPPVFVNSLTQTL